MIRLNTNPIVAELMAIPRPTRRRIQEILKIVHKDGYINGRIKEVNLKKYEKTKKV